MLAVVRNRARRHRTLTAVMCIWLLLACFGGWPVNVSRADEPKFDDAAIEFFERQVRPLLVERCLECHGRGDVDQGGLRLDSRSALLKGGDTGAAIVPGEPKQSLLIDAINYGELYEMPPKSKLPQAEIAVLTKWVSMGAPWPHDDGRNAAAAEEEFDLHKRRQEHWAWQPIADPAIPEIQRNEWPRQTLDAFVLARLEQQGLEPARQADRRTLIRRLYFDLIGLPPTPEEVATFLGDTSDDAYAELVDRLLDSPHFGERWARHWLDLVRYAETCGHEFDYPIRHAWRYRDYVIRAFDEDVPYDQFLMEHVAGDLLPEPRRNAQEDFNESIIGTGFWFLHEATHAPVDVRGDEALRIDNQIDVLTKTFLGMTVACARCHDHKFDAISTRDYYAMAGFLQSSRRQEALLDPHQRKRQVAAELQELHKQGSELLGTCVPRASTSEAERFAQLLNATRSQSKSTTVDEEILNRWRTALEDPQIRRPDHPLYLWYVMSERRDAWPGADAWAEQSRRFQQLTKAKDENVNAPLVTDFAAKDFGGWLVAGDAFTEAPTSAQQWDRYEEQPQFHRPAVAHSGRIGRKLMGVLRSPTFTITHRNIFYRLAGQDAEVRLIVDGYVMIEFHQLLFAGLKFPVKSPDGFTWHRQSGDLHKYLGHRAHLELVDSGDGWLAVDEVQFSDEPIPEPLRNPLGRQIAAKEQVSDWQELAHAYGEVWNNTLHAWHEGESEESGIRLINWMFRHGLIFSDRGKLEQTKLELDRIRQRMNECERSLPEPMRITAICDGSGENESVHVRGNHRTLADQVPRRLLEALGGVGPLPTEEGSGRLQLARRMVHPYNPLTARVAVNRIWHHLLGRGIVPTVDNLGVLGQPPTHPKLLDHLAGQFVRDDWSVKRLIRRIVTSSTYQMASRPSDEGDAVDPANQWLHRMRIRRLEGEAIRDAILAVSGRLDRTSFGPSVPVHITSFMQGRGRPNTSGPLDGKGRRSIYMEVRRNFLPPMMLAFDVPVPFNTMGRRNVSNVPAQALILMNDPFVIEQSRVWARRLLADKSATSEERIEQMYETAFARPPKKEELDDALAFLVLQARQRELDPIQSEQDEDVWTDLCHILFNVKEFVFLD